MTDYTVPLQDMRFVLEHVADCARCQAALDDPGAGGRQPDVADQAEQGQAERGGADRAERGAEAAAGELPAVLVTPLAPPRRTGGGCRSTSTPPGSRTCGGACGDRWKRPTRTCSRPSRAIARAECAEAISACASRPPKPPLPNRGIIIPFHARRFTRPAGFFCPRSATNPLPCVRADAGLV